jgi:hypothetical protein
LGLAAQWLNYKNVIDYNQRGIIYDVEEKKLSLVRPNSPTDYRRSGNYGEIKDNVFHRENGWRDIRKEHPNMNIDKPTAPGIDGAYEKGGVYRVTDSKYGTARIAKTTTGRELSQTWIENHLNNGAIRNQADTDAVRRANTNGTLQREVIYTDKIVKDSNRVPQKVEGLSSETHNSAGFKQTIGQSQKLEMKPLSKATGFINKSRSAFRNSQPIQSLANSRFSQSIRSSTAATRSNNALWRATQFMESSPALRTTGRVVGRGTIVVGIALDGYSIVTAYAEEGKFGNKTQQATGSAVGGAAGAWVFGQAGAAIGTAICPGVGTVIGGLVGGVFGGIAGSGMGSELVDWLF